MDDIGLNSYQEIEVPEDTEDEIDYEECWYSYAREMVLDE